MSPRQYLVGSSVLGVATLLSVQPAMAQTANAMTSAPTTTDQNMAPATSAQDTALTTSAENAAPADEFIGDIVVTAQKREESLNRVPMSITVATDEELRNAGVTQVRDLVKITPGLTYADSTTGTPIYTIRGIGFSDIALAGRPAVSVYADQAPIPFSVEARGAFLDLERVEVLKGPQGTLFGSNTTGGAINFIAARPTSDFEVGADLSYGRFNSREISAFVSGPITSTLRARIAVAHEGMDAWQQSYTTDEETGVEDFWNGRLTLDWAPTDRLSTSFTLNRWIDHSDTQAPQLIAVVPSTPFPVPELDAYPLAPRTPRAADFDVGRNYRRDNDFVQANFRLDYEIADDLTVTSLTSYSHYDEDQLSDLDGTTLFNNFFETLGELRSISQELRLAGSFGNRGRFTIGGYYADDDTSELNLVNSPLSSVSNLFSFIFGTPLPITFDTTTNQDSVTKAVFGSLDYNLTDAINVYGGVRYTDFRTDFSGCSADSGDGVAATIFTALSGSLVLPGECFTITESGVGGIVTSVLDEDNVSWRAGIQWTVAPRIMFYANVSRGYKAGSFPAIPADSFRAFFPVTQESVLAYEAGFRAGGLFGGALQVNGALFHYDYENKQLLGSVILEGIGVVTRFVNVPESRINGAELEVAAVPVRGLRISASGTYIDSQVTGSFMNIDPLGNRIDFEGQRFPNTPRWQLSSDAEYRWPVSGRLEAFLGGNLYYQSATNSAFGDLDLFRTKSYALLDLRAGIETADGRLRGTIWGRNVTNTYYWSSATRAQDAIVRYIGMPATYGISLALRY